MRGVARCPAWVVRHEIWVGPGTAPSDRPGAAMVQTPHLSPPLPPFTASATLARRRPGPLVWLLARLTVGPPAPHDRVRIYSRHVRLKLVIFANVLKMVKHGARFLMVVNHEITHVRAIHLMERCTIHGVVQRASAGSEWVQRWRGARYVPGVQRINHCVSSERDKKTKIWRLQCESRARTRSITSSHV